MGFILVNIGSNLGNRRLNLSRAMAAIADRFGDFEISHVVESDPVGFDSTNSFLNVGMAFHSEEEPSAILHALQEIEGSISPLPHRNPDGSYADRVIDIDIIAIDRRQIETEELTLPHPRMREREFVLAPLQELAPRWTHPLTGETPFEMLMKLRQERKNREEQL